MPSMPPSFTGRVRSSLHKYSMILPNERVVAAVSGGPDSVCLLEILSELAIPFIVAHFDHQTRAGQSGQDAEFVRNLCIAKGLQFFCETRPVAQEAEKRRLSFEAYARDVRYDTLFRIAREQRCAVVATGHHADDQAETLLMRILRGTTLHGLSGIPPVRHEGGIRLVRPLIETSRNEILAYLDERGVSYRIDSSNEDPSYLRNRIRHELLPYLRNTYNPCVENALNRLSEVFRAENELLDTQSEAALDACTDREGAIVRQAFAEMHVALQRRVLLRMGWEKGVDCPFERVEALRGFITHGPAGRAADLGGGTQLYNNRGTTELRTTTAPTDKTEVSLAIPGDTVAFGTRFAVQFLDARPAEPLARFCRPNRQVFDAERLGGRLVVRHRRPGDRFVPFGMSGTRKLQDYLVDVGLPAGRRDVQLLLVGEEGIAWIVGRAISHHAAVTAKTTRILQVEVKDATE